MIWASKACEEEGFGFGLQKYGRAEGTKCRNRKTWGKCVSDDMDSGVFRAVDHGPP